MRSDATSGLLRRALAASRWLFGPSALAFIAIAGWRAREVFAEVLARTEPAAIAIAVGLWLLAHLAAPWSSSIVLDALGARVRYRDLLAIHVARLPARYLPGGIWHTVSRVMDLHARGIGRRELTIMVVLENSLPLATAALLGGACLGLAGKVGWPALAAALAGVLVLVAAHVALRHRSLRGVQPLPLRAFLAASGASTLFWTIAAAAFLAYWRAFPAAGASALEVAGTYLVAWAAGFASVFAPQGLGVFEAVAAVFLDGGLGFAGAAALVAGFRLVLLVADLLAWLALQALRGFSARVAAN